MANFQDFLKLDLRVGKVLAAEPHPQADKLYLLKVDTGDKVRQLVAGIRAHYAQEELIGKLIVVLINLEPKQIRGQLSEGMLLAASSGDKVILVTPEQAAEVGSKIK